MNHVLPIFLTRRGRSPVIALAAGLALALGLSGCGSDAAPTAAAGGSSASTGALADEVAKMSAPLDSFPVPTEPITGVDALKGKTVYYIPLTQQAPAFTVTAAALAEALGTVGVKSQVCDGGANPSAISACINQAVGARAAGIVTDAIPYVMAANALDAAQKAGVPVLVADQIPDGAHPAGPTLAYQEGAGTEMLEAVSKWIVVNSKGTAKVVLNMATDNPSSIQYAKAGEKVLTEQCPGCKVTVNQVTAANFSLISSSTSSAILKTPGVNYVISEFDNYLQPTIGGVQQSGKTAAVKGVSSAATLASLKMVKDQNFLHAEAAQALPYQGWTLADAIMRLALKQKVLDLEVPFRLFTRDNIADVTLTEQAESSGEWFGPVGFKDQFRTTWGLS
jgi:ribose transport system substrate-binding protein